MKKPETTFGERVDKDLRKIFGKNIWIENIQQVGKRGTPDRLICLDGDFIAMELKIDSGAPADIQLIKLIEIKKAGGKSYIVYPHTWEIILDEIKAAYGYLICTPL